jgi:thioesterase domain-containing protein
MTAHWVGEFEAYGLHLPAKDGVFQPFTTMEAMAAYHVERICEIQPTGPYYLAGYSFGVWVGLEIAQQLVASGREVRLLVAVEAGPFPRHNYEWKHFSVLRFLSNAFNWVRDDLLQAHPLESLDQVRLKLKAAAQRMGVVARPAGRPEALIGLESWLDMDKVPEQGREVVESSYLASQSYVPKPYAGRVAVFRARTQPLFQPLPDDLRWGEIAQGGVEVHVFKGNHWKIMSKPVVGLVAEQVRKCVEKTHENMLLSDRRSVCHATPSEGGPDRFRVPVADAPNAEPALPWPSDPAPEVRPRRAAVRRAEDRAEAADRG